MKPVSEREFVRRQVETDCVVVTADGDRLLADRSVDMSYDGVLVESYAEARLGEPVRLSLRIPRTGVWIDAEGRVARVSAGRRQSDRSPTVGIRITRMGGMDRVVLGTVLKKYPQTRPARGPGRSYVHELHRIAGD